jgi:diguanylate cyclase (GGDEF)-like protein
VAFAVEADRAKDGPPERREAIAPVAWLRKLGEPEGIDQHEAACLRGAQAAVLMRYTTGIIAANLLNGLVLAAALSFRPPGPAPYVWLAVLLLYLGLLLRRRYRRRRRSLPKRASRALIVRATLYAGALGAIWSAAPVLFFDAAQSDHLVVACVSIGMLCGGTFALAAVPAAVLAFTLPLALGCLFGLVHGAHDATQYLVALLLLTYMAILLRVALSHGRQFADRVVAQTRAEAAALHDPLTALPNRSAFETALRGAFGRLERYGERFSLFCLDLNGFKAINDRLGHQAGDQLLRQVAGRLAGAVRAGETIARVGGDEFVMIVRGGADANDAERRADEMARCFDAPFVLEPTTVLCRASIGIAQAPSDGADPVSLIGCADAALYKAKRESAQTSAHFFNPGEDVKARGHRELAHDLCGAADRGEFFLEYQPIQRLATGRVESCEALVRWRHPRYGVLSPARFVALAEGAGVIHEIGEWIMREACAEAKRWPGDIRVAVNVSAHQITDRSILRVVERALEDAGLHPKRLVLEITESALLGETDGAGALSELNARGVSIVLDDFGTGYSSLDHLRRLPIGGLKIDRSFIAAVPFNRKTCAIVHAVGELAGALDLSVVAEGVETEFQLDFLRQARVELGQGYYFARPQTGEALLEGLSAASLARQNVA